MLFIMTESSSLLMSTFVMFQSVKGNIKTPLSGFSQGCIRDRREKPGLCEDLQRIARPKQEYENKTLYFFHNSNKHRTFDRLHSQLYKLSVT